VRLSTGERQRLALLRALGSGPAVLLLDEPTGALDEGNTALVETLLAGLLAAGSTVLMVTHNPAQAARLGRRHLRLENRRLIEP
ncbi:MAG: ATP-binding cassette domain-containing protein, partial [Acetobacteraceae bacterium]